MANIKKALALKKYGTNPAIKVLVVTDALSTMLRLLGEELEEVS